MRSSASSGRTGPGAHDLLRMARTARILDWAGESQYYVEPKRLARLGYLTARTEPGKTRPRTVYTLTDKGLEALGEWARTPVRFTPVKSELLLRLLIADLVGEAATRESITTIRDDIADLFTRLGESEEFARDAAFADQVPAARLRLPAPPARASPRVRRRSRTRAGGMTEGLDLHLGVDKAAGFVGRALEAALREAIRSGRLHPGARLPGSRSLAADLGISRGTVVQAYAQLIAEGWLTGTTGSGTRVADLPGPGPRGQPAAAPGRTRRRRRRGSRSTCGPDGRTSVHSPERSGLRAFAAPCPPPLTRTWTTPSPPACRCCAPRWPTT